ncbi:ureidoglycolate lyase [Rhizobium sp. YIM 134829]|uniref:ureidoglycolate lyase n=1 Tax=Rhizobium sp. YIM 134829 TaxID=3390453 RepID=UPI0039781DC7
MSAGATAVPIPLVLETLTAEAFAPFGTVLEADPATMRLINGGTTERFHALGVAQALGEGARVILNLFRGQPRAFPYAIDMMERHPLGSQSFTPLNGAAWLVAVADDEDGRPGRPRVFAATGSQGVNYRPNTWHHPLIAVGSVQDFLVVDRDGPGLNLEERAYDRPFHIDLPIV